MYDTLVIDVSSVDFEGVRVIKVELEIIDDSNEVIVYVSRNIKDLIDVFIHKAEKKYQGYHIRVKNI